MPNSADRHRECQALSVLIDLSRDECPASNIGGMGKPFQDALRWHMDEHGTSIPELADGTGVSADVIKKLRRSPPYSTTVENGIALSSFYGKTVEQFIRCDKPTSNAAEASGLFSLLREDEARLLLAQVRGILGSRAQRSG